MRTSINSPLTILLAAAFLGAAASTSVAAENSAPPIRSQIGVEVSSGQNETGSLSLNGTLGFTPEWGLEISGSGSKSSSQTRSSEVAFGPLWRPAAHHELRLLLNAGQFSSANGQFSGRRRGADLDYTLGLGDLMSWQQATDLTVGVGSGRTIYDGELAETDTAFRFRWDQGAFDFLRFGLGFETTQYSAASPLSLRPRRASRIGDTRGATENSGLFYLGFILTNDDELRLEVERTKYPTEIGTTGEISWNHVHNEHWDTRISAARTVFSNSDTYGSLGLGVNYTF